jgi:hypothetical protein
MEFTDENKQTILDFLKSGQRQAALSFISAKYNVSDEDAQKLLSAFEAQFRATIELTPAIQATSAFGFSGCFSGILKVISVLIGFLGLGILGAGYYMPEVLGGLAKNLTAPENLRVPVTVVDQYFYASPDSSNVRLIYEIKHNNQTKYDTSNTIYSVNMYFKGDTLLMESHDLNFKKQLTDLALKAQLQNGLYILGCALLFFALIFWIVGAKFS